MLTVRSRRVVPGHACRCCESHRGLGCNRARPSFAKGFHLSPSLRRVLAGLITFVITAPVSFVLFSMALMVAEAVIFPTAMLATAVITALVGSWTAGWLAGDGRRADFNRVVRGNLVWAILPAIACLAYLRLAAHIRPDLLLGVTLIWTTGTAVGLAFRHRKISGAGNSARSLAWLVKTTLTVAAIIFTASLFGLTGA